MNDIRIQTVFLRTALLAACLLMLVSCEGAGTPAVTPTLRIAESAPVTSAAQETVPTPSPTRPAQPTPVPLPTGVVREAVPDSAHESVQALQAAAHPPTDYYRMAVQILGMSPDQLVPELMDAGELQVNDRTNFLVSTNMQSANLAYDSTPARLRHVSDSAYWWATVKVTASDADIAAAAKRFEETVVPINQTLFGKEWSPGIDGDERIHILLIYEPNDENTYGYFSDVNEYPQALFEDSNQKEMFFINVGGSRVDSEAFAGELAHEYQHLIHWNQDLNEDLWLNESMASLVSPEGVKVMGLSNEVLFSENPDIQLTARPERSFSSQEDAHYAHYAAERLFSIYLLEQFGGEFIRAVVSNPEPGVMSIQEELNKIEGAPKFEDVYATWLLANFLDMPDLRQGQFGYTTTDPISPVPQIIQSFGDEPLHNDLPPYGAHYYQINSDQTVKVDFSGSTLAPLTAADPAGGQYAWYSNRGDGSDFTLTRSFDLTGLQTATLNYQVWYELEPLFDFAYLEVSTDNGEHWTILETGHGTDEDPNRLSYGFGYSGASGEWLSESIDLSAYTGQEILIRFEVIHDFTTNQDGFQVDNIEIPELGFFDGAEDNQAGWEAQGFIRSSNRVPANWVAWLVKPGPEIEWIDLQPDQSASFEITGFGEDFNFALLVVSPTAPVTTQELDYELIFRH